MSTLTIELTDADALRVAERARSKNMTPEEWAALQLTGRRRKRVAEELNEKGYPIGWFEKNAGALADVDDFVEPPDSPSKPIEPIEL